MRKSLILASLLFTTATGIKADSLPEGVEARLDYIGGNPRPLYVPKDQNKIEEVPKLDSQSVPYRSYATGNTSGSATPATAPDWETSTIDG